VIGGESRRQSSERNAGDPDSISIDPVREGSLVGTQCQHSVDQEGDVARLIDDVIGIGSPGRVESCQRETRGDDDVAVTCEVFGEMSPSVTSRHEAMAVDDEWPESLCIGRRPQGDIELSIWSTLEIPIRIGWARRVDPGVLRPLDGMRTGCETRGALRAHGQRIGSGDAQCDPKSDSDDEHEAGENAEGLHECETPAVIGWS